MVLDDELFRVFMVIFRVIGKTLISILTAILYVSWAAHRKHGLPGFWLKQPSTERNILRSVDGIDSRGFPHSWKQWKNHTDYVNNAIRIIRLLQYRFQVNHCEIWIMPHVIQINPYALVRFQVNRLLNVYKYIQTMR